MIDNEFTCSICGDKFIGWGNNPWPITLGEDDKCCDMCNSVFVIPARFRKALGGNIGEK